MRDDCALDGLATRARAVGQKQGVGGHHEEQPESPEHRGDSRDSRAARPLSLLLGLVCALTGLDSSPMAIQLTLPQPKPFSKTTRAAIAAAIACTTAAILLQGTATHWDPVHDLLHKFRFKTSTTDLVAAATITDLLAILALFSAPLLSLAISAITTLFAIAKIATIATDVQMLHGGHLAAAAAILSLVAACCTSVAALLARRPAARTIIEVGSCESTSTVGSLQAEKLLVSNHGGAREERVKRDPTFFRLLSLARPELGMLVNATVALFLSSACQMAMPALVGNMIGGVIGSSTKSVEDRYAALESSVAQLAVIFVAGGFFSFVRGYLFTLAGERVVARIRRVLFSCLIVQDISFFDTNKTGELMNRLSSDTTVIQSAVTINVSMGLRFGAQVIIGIILIFFESWRLSLLMLSIIPPIVVVGVVYGRFMRSFSKRYQKALADASDVAQESFSSIRTVRSFSNEEHEATRYMAHVEESYALGRRKALSYGLFGSIISTVGQFSVVGVLWYGGSLVLDNIQNPKENGMTPAKLTSFLLYTVVIAGCLGGLSDLFGSLMNALGASSRVFSLLDSRATVPLTGGQAPGSVRGLLQFHNVHFSYPSRPEVPILRGINITVEPGTVLALCGPSGSGKSTIIGLIERWYEPTEGSIYVDGRRLDSLDPSWWRRQMALVAQEPVLFACSILENVSYGRANATDLQVNDALRTANALDFVSAMPEGVNTKVGERGVQLSGGQKQRVAIARALLMDPKVLLLDEATSALDSESEHVVQEAIDRLMAERTTIMIAHRLSTIRDADCICVVCKGQIVERGRHEQLLELGGLYTQLTSRQMLRAGSGTDYAMDRRNPETAFMNKSAPSPHGSTPHML